VRIKQRFGAGFYFALQSSKSHEYPIGQMQGLPIGKHTREMLLCKLACGKEYVTEVNMDREKVMPPRGFNSVHGVAGGVLNYDEIVVYEEEAVLPYAVVSYEFEKV
jgi:hypothetical protein